jgi:hypothetical protein
LTHFEKSGTISAFRGIHSRFRIFVRRRTRPARNTRHTFQVETDVIHPSKYSYRITNSIDEAEQVFFRLLETLERTSMRLLFFILAVKQAIHYLSGH